MDATGQQPRPKLDLSRLPSSGTLQPQLTAVDQSDNSVQPGTLPLYGDQPARKPKPRGPFTGFPQAVQVGYPARSCPSSFTGKPSPASRPCLRASAGVRPPGVLRDHGKPSLQGVEQKPQVIPGDHVLAVWPGDHRLPGRAEEDDPHVRVGLLELDPPGNLVQRVAGHSA